MFGRRRAAVFVAPLASGLAAALLCLAGGGDRAGLRAYDALLGLRPSRESSRETLLVQMGEVTGPREWDGEGIAEGLLSMAEHGARYVVFAAPGTLDAAARAKDGAAAADLAAAIDEEFALIDQNVAALFDAIRLGSVQPRESPRLVAELLETIGKGRARLLDEAAGAAREDRARLEGAARALGRVYVAIDPLSSLSSRRSPPIEGAAGRGSSRLLVDPDGGRRRVALNSDRKGDRLEHVAFVALLDRLGGPTVAYSAGSVTLRGGSLGKGELEIPLSRGGLLLDWPRPGVAPRRLPWGELARAALLERELVEAIGEMARAGCLTAAGGALPGLYDYAAALGEEALRSGTIPAEWREARQRFFDLAARYLEGPAEGELVAAALASPSPEGAGLVPALFEGARETSAELARTRRGLRAALEGSFCVVAPSYADDGARPTPFGEEPSEGLAAAALAQSILSGSFLRELSPLLGAAIGAGLGLAAALAYLALRPRWALVLALALALAGAGGCAALFLARGVYLSPLAPAAGPLAAGIAGLVVAALL